MLEFENLQELKEADFGFGLALGVFDGVHLGHQAVIDAARGEGKLGVLTFEPHPVHVLAPSRAPRRILANLEHKKRILSRLEVDFLVVIPFTLEFAKQAAEAFVDQLVGSGACKLAAGEDWRFGQDRSGSMERLQRWAGQIEVVAVPPVKMHGERISSTRIRQCLRDNRLDAAAEMLGRPYSVFGAVVEGQKLGRTIGFPTANVQVADEQLPPNGVYQISGNGHPGVANIGTRPTVTDSKTRSLEVHLFSDEIPDTYGWELEVSFQNKIREEKKFQSVEDLRAQIAKDVAEAQAGNV